MRWTQARNEANRRPHWNSDYCAISLRSRKNCISRERPSAGVEQSPVSRAMRNLEATLGVQLFDRSAHQTRLTWAGQVFLGECRRVLATVEQAVSAAKAAAQGYQGYLRIAICDSCAAPLPPCWRAAAGRARTGDSRLRAAFRAAAQDLHNDLLDIGFALSDAVSEGLVAEPVWTDPLSVIVPVRHPCWRTRKCIG